MMKIIVIIMMIIIIIVIIMYSPDLLATGSPSCKDQLLLTT